uniref:Uncharacterized protein n=1 Tax=Clandestinovirus TaxID=2831644 RepID=A0A8F8KLH5_9VIRU|nr:hypothetical protein KOM_12_27 [Clandestinovirus]
MEKLCFSLTDTHKVLMGALMVLLVPFLAKIYQRNATYKSLSHLLSMPAIYLFFLMPLVVEGNIATETGPSAYIRILATYIIGSQFFGYFHHSLDTLTRFSVSAYIFVFHGLWFRSLPLFTFYQRVGWHLLVNSIIYLLLIICVASDEDENDDTVDFEDFASSDNEQSDSESEYDSDSDSDCQDNARPISDSTSTSTSDSSSSDANEWDFPNDEEYSFHVQENEQNSDSESDSESEPWPPVSVETVESITQAYAHKFNMAPVLDTSADVSFPIAVDYNNEAAAEDLPDAGLENDDQFEEVSIDSITIGGRTNS